MRPFLCLLFSFVHLSGESLIFTGHTTFTDQLLEDVTIHGPAHFKNCTVTKLATIKGPLDAVDSTLTNLYIHGIAKLDHVEVGELYTTGILFVLNSIIEEISILSDELSLTNTRVAKLLVRKGTKPQTVYLEKGSEVDWIQFERKGGIVIIADRSSTVEKVDGGTVSYSPYALKGLMEAKANSFQREETKCSRGGHGRFTMSDERSSL